MRSIARSKAAHIITLGCLCWALFCRPYESNAWPLAFGMTPKQAAAALGAPLTYESGAPGSEVYLAHNLADIPGLFPADAMLALQFRHGRLTGWKANWAMRKPWVVY